MCWIRVSLERAAVHLEAKLGGVPLFPPHDRGGQTTGGRGDKRGPSVQSKLPGRLHFQIAYLIGRAITPALYVEWGLVAHRDLRRGAQGKMVG